MYSNAVRNGESFQYSRPALPPYIAVRNSVYKEKQSGHARLTKKVTVSNGNWE